jgi:hypothetical protein
MLLETTVQLCRLMSQHCTALHCTALHCTALHCTALHCTALHCTAPHCTALHCTALHCTALHCTALHCLSPRGRLIPPAASCVSSALSPIKTTTHSRRKFLRNIMKKKTTFLSSRKLFCGGGWSVQCQYKCRQSVRSDIVLHFIG